MARIDRGQVLDLLSSLAAKSFIACDPDAMGGGRYRMLETVRQYAQERLTETGEAPGVRHRHAGRFLALAEEDVVDQAECLSRLEADHDNLRAAVDWYEASGRRGNALRLAGRLGWFWLVRGYFTEGRGRLLRTLAATGTAEERARALNAAGTLALAQHDYNEARALFSEGLAAARTAGNPRQVAAGLNSLGRVAHDSASRGGPQEAYEQARGFWQESLRVYEQMGDRAGAGIVLGNLGLVAAAEGDRAQARTLYEQSLVIAHEVGDLKNAALCLTHLGGLRLEDKDPAGARTFLEEALALSRRLGDKGRSGDILYSLGWLASSEGDYSRAIDLHTEQLSISRDLGDRVDVGLALTCLANTAMCAGDLTSARAWHEEALRLRQELGHPWEVAYSLTDLGNISLAEGDTGAAYALYVESLMAWRGIGNRRGVAFALTGMVRACATWQSLERAARMAGAVAALTKGCGSPLPPSELRAYERDLDGMRTALGNTAFDESWEAGRAMTLEQAVEYALEQADATN